MDEKRSDKLLVVSHKPPYPPVDGGCIAMEKFGLLLEDLFREADHFILSTPKHPFIKEAFPASWNWGINAFHYCIDTAIKPSHIAGFIKGGSIRVSRFYKKEVEETLLKIITEKKTELVIFESIYAAVYAKAIRQHTSAKILVRSHNIEYKIWEEKVRSTGNPLKKAILRSENKKLETYEKDCYTGADGNIFISENDLSEYVSFSGKNNSLYIPVQMETTGTVSPPSKAGLRLFHIGAMDWEPNITGLEKFIQDIFPGILKHHPGTELHLAGKSMPSSFKKYETPHIFIHGEVPSSQAFMQAYDVLVVPIETGSGIRIKILEAMAAGKPVITTPAGISGIQAVNGKHFMLADTAAAWDRAVEQLCIPEVYASVASEAGAWLNDHYSTAYLRSALKNYLTNILTL